MRIYLSEILPLAFAFAVADFCILYYRTSELYTKCTSNNMTATSTDFHLPFPLLPLLYVFISICLSLFSLSCMCLLSIVNTFLNYPFLLDLHKTFL